jgi:uncharacterized RDD family membrane protein YckC
MNQTEENDYSEIMLNKENHVVVWRWLATVIDIFVMIGFLLLMDYSLGNELYQKTIFIWLIALFLYHPLLEGFLGITLGKLIVGTRVVNKSGRPPGFVKALIRTLTRIFEVNPIFLGGIPAGVTALISVRSQRVGDMLAGTYVCSKNLIAINDRSI